MTLDAIPLFEDRFGVKPAAARFTPGRVNLIGEHTDYNGGAVLPVALSLGVAVALSPRSDNQVRVASDDFDTLATRTLVEGPSGHWSDYALGCIDKANKAGWLSGGADIAVRSNLPMGAGLSSSSALIVAGLKLARQLADSMADDIEIAQMARAVETDFIGMPCGIMDQMAVSLAPSGQALFLDTLTLDIDLISLSDDPVIAILHSGVHRELSDGRYKIRKEECDRVRTDLGRDDICRADLEDIHRIKDPVTLRRARHCITEHRRTMAAADALRTGNIETLGDLMNESHLSMRDDFQITTPEIDALVATCQAEGAYGARMTGGGFGGCIVALVSKDRMADWKQRVLAQHPKAFDVA